MTATKSREFWVTNHLANPVLRPLLRGPLGPRLGRRLAVLRYRGRRTGQVHELVVQYVRHYSQVWIMPGDAQRKRWWRNMLDPQSVDMWLGGRHLTGVASLVRDASDSELLSEALAAYSAAFPRATKATVMVLVDLAPETGRPEEASAAVASWRLRYAVSSGEQDRPCDERDGDVADEHREPGPRGQRRGIWRHSEHRRAGLRREEAGEVAVPCRRQEGADEGNDEEQSDQCGDGAGRAAQDCAQAEPEGANCGEVERPADDGPHDARVADRHADTLPGEDGLADAEGAEGGARPTVTERVHIVERTERILVHSARATARKGRPSDGIGGGRLTATSSGVVAVMLLLLDSWWPDRRRRGIRMPLG